MKYNYGHNKNLVLRKTNELLKQLEDNVEGMLIEKLDELDHEIFDEVDGFVEEITDLSTRVLTLPEVSTKETVIRDIEEFLSMRKEYSDLQERVMSKDVITRLNEKGLLISKFLDPFYKEITYDIAILRFCNCFIPAKKCENRLNVLSDKITVFTNNIVAERVKANQTIFNEVESRFVKLFNNKWDIFCKYCEDNKLMKVNRSDENVDDDNNIQIDRRIMSHKEIESKLKELGYTSTRQKGSHRIYQKDSKSIPVPIHSGDMGKGLSIKIQKQSQDI